MRDDGDRGLLRLDEGNTIHSVVIRVRTRTKDSADSSQP